MADFTPAQKAAMSALLAGTFDKLDTSPRLQPSYSVDQVYKGIIPSNGGSSEAKAQSLTSRPVQTVRIDATGNPVMPSGSGGSAALRGTGGTLQASAAVDAINGMAPHASGTIDSNKLAYRLSPGEAGLPANYGGSPQPLNVPMPRRRPDVPQPFLSGDPGVTDWSIANPGATGLFGLPAQGRMAGPNPLPNRLPVIPKQAVIAAQPKPAAPAPSVRNNINRFLSEQGQNTAGMTEGERANAFRKAMGF